MLGLPVKRDSDVFGLGGLDFTRKHGGLKGIERIFSCQAKRVVCLSVSRDFSHLCESGYRNREKYYRDR